MLNIMQQRHIIGNLIAKALSV